MTDNTNDISSTPSGDPWLLTPGPLTTSLSVKQAMLHDYGSRDATFIDLNARILDRLVAIVNGSGSYVTVPLQGSGTFVVEAMIGNFVPADGRLLILINGAYGQRIAKICDYYKRDYLVQESPEDVPVDTDQLDATLDADPTIGHVVLVHCETTSGILNPIKAVSEIVARHKRSLLIDSMSAFGALPLDAREIEFDAVVASSNKCLEARPGWAFALRVKAHSSRPRAIRRRWCLIFTTSGVRCRKTGNGVSRHRPMYCSPSTRRLRSMRLKVE
jgi:2-aminoethylphosphonate-pyruvate transaminase